MVTREAWQFRQVPGWGAACFFDFGNGVVGGPDRGFANLRNGEAKPAKADWLPRTEIRGMARAGQQQTITAEG